jgi:hypothetical protein
MAVKLPGVVATEGQQSKTILRQELSGTRQPPLKRHLTDKPTHSRPPTPVAFFIPEPAQRGFFHF